MRIFLTVLAVILVCVLAAALSLPAFVDWRAYRGQIEVELSQAIGAPLRVDGAIDARLLPIPYLRLEGVHTETSDALTVREVRLWPSFAALLQGAVRFDAVTLNSPAIKAELSADGALLVGASAGAATKTLGRIDRLTLRDGKLQVSGADHAEILVLDGLEFDGGAETGRGPFRGSGSVRRGDGKAEFHFTTGNLSSDALPIKGGVDLGAGAAQTEFDGALHVASGLKGGLRISYQGAAILTGSAPATRAGETDLGWRLTGTVLADSEGFVGDVKDARLGTEERGLSLTGPVRVSFRPTPRVILDWRAKRLDVDALLRPKGVASVAPIQAYARLRNAFVALFGSENAAPTIEAHIASPLLIVGADAIDDLDVKLSAVPGKPIGLRLEAEVPGGNHVLADGALVTGAAALFTGKLDAKFADAPRLAAWAGRDAGMDADRAAALRAALPFASAALSADVALSAVAFKAENVKLTADREEFTGAFIWTESTEGAPRRLYLDLSTNALDVDAAPNLSAAAAALKDADLRLVFAAKSLHAAKIGEAGVDGGSLAVRLEKAGEAVTLERFSIVGLAGASIEARGSIAAHDSRIEGKLDAADLKGLATLINRVAPSFWTGRLLERVAPLSPAKAVFSLRSASDEFRTFDRWTAANFDVIAGGTRIKTEFGRPTGGAEGDFTAKVEVESPDAPALLRQIGLNPAYSPPPAFAKARALIDAHGKWASGFDAQVTGSFAGADLSWRGRVKPNAPEAEPVFSGQATWRSGNTGPALGLIGWASNEGAAGPLAVDLAAQVDWRDGRVDVGKLAGQIAGTKTTGAIAWRRPDPDAPAPTGDPDAAVKLATGTEARTGLFGELTLDHVNFAQWAGVALGTLSAPKGNARWSDQKFGAPLASPPSGDIRATVLTLDFPAGVQARNAFGRIKIGGGRLDFEDVALTLANGQIGGHVDLRRDGADATLSAKITWSDLTTAKPSAYGRSSGELELVGAGASPAAMISALAGDGRVRFVGAFLPKLDPAALGRIVVKARAPEFTIDEASVLKSLGAEMDKQALTLPEAPIAISVSGGVAHLGPLVMPGAEENVQLAGEYDLRALSFDVQGAVAEAKAVKPWGIPPSISVGLKGLPDAALRKIDSANFVSGLAAIAIAREGDRIAAQEADLLERSAFNRKFKADAFIRKRTEEVNEYMRKQDEFERIKRDEEQRRRPTEPARNAISEPPKAQP